MEAFLNLGWKDSNLRNAWTKTRCLTTWRHPISYTSILIALYFFVKQFFIFNFYFCFLFLFFISFFYIFCPLYLFYVLSSFFIWFIIKWWLNMIYISQILCRCRINNIIIVRRKISSDKLFILNLFATSI